MNEPPTFGFGDNFKVFLERVFLTTLLIHQLSWYVKILVEVYENLNFRDLIEKGKGNLQWERDIPPAALANLEDLAKKDFKGNLGQIIHDIYQTAHLMFGDMPQGDHKKRAKLYFVRALAYGFARSPFFEIKV